MMSEGFDFFNQISLFIYFYLLLVPLFIFLVLRIAFKPRKLFLPLVYLGLFLSAFYLSRLIGLVIFLALPVITRLSKPTLDKLTQSLSSIIYLASVALIFISTASQTVIGSREHLSLIYGSIEDGQMTKRPVGAVNRFHLANFPREISYQLINQNLDGRRLFSSAFWNNFFIWHSPQVKTFSSGLIDYRTTQDVADQTALQYGTGNWQDLLDQYKIDIVVNTQPFIFYANNTPVYTLPSWKLVFVDDQVQIWAKSNIVRSQPVDLSAIELSLPQDLKFKTENEVQAVGQLQKLIEFDPQNGFAQDQLILYYLEKDPQKAKNLAEVFRQTFPKNPIASLRLAAIYTKLGNCRRSHDFAKEAIARSFNHPIIKAEVAKVLSGCP